MNARIYFAVISICWIFMQANCTIVSQSQQVQVKITDEELPWTDSTINTSETTITTPSTTPTTETPTTPTTPTPTTPTTPETTPSTETPTESTTNCNCETTQLPCYKCNGNVVYNFFEKLFPGYIHEQTTEPSTTKRPTTLAYNYHPTSSNHYDMNYEHPVFNQRHDLIEQLPAHELADVVDDLLSQFGSGSYSYGKQRPTKPRNYKKRVYNNPKQYYAKRYNYRPSYDEEEEDEDHGYHSEEYRSNCRKPYRKYY
ncbi:LAMP1.2 family protein [Megaselia abdita]